jgi:hypothetical protein
MGLLSIVLPSAAKNSVLLSYVLIVLTTVVLYLLACDPLPPCTGTVKHWVRRWVPSRDATAANQVGQRRSAA